MDYYEYAGISLSIALPAITGWIRFRRPDPAFLPFLWLMWVGLFNEMLNIVLALSIHNNSISSNIYLLLSSVLITEQFRRWNLFREKKNVYQATVIFLVSAWIIHVLWLSSSAGTNWILITLRAFIICLMSMRYVTGVIFSHYGPLFRDSRFLIAMCWLLQFLIFLMVNGFLQLATDASIAYTISVYELYVFINAFVNLVFTIAIIWIPRKLKYIPGF